MNKQIDALKLALEALEICENDGYIPVRLTRESITAIKEALAQPEQEPVAWNDENVIAYCLKRGIEAAKHVAPQRKPLTDEQVWNDDDLMKLNAVMMLPMDYFMRVVHAVEVAHGIKEKNT